MIRITVFVFCFLIANITAVAQNTIGGIGAQLFLDTADGFTMPRILSLVQGSPAYDSLKATDYIISVNRVTCKNKPIDQVVGMIRGTAGSFVHIVVADTKQGTHSREYDLKRVSMQVAGPPDPVPAFNDWCSNEVAQLKKKGFEIVKTYTSECGNYFFNFDAESGGYRARVYSMKMKDAANYTAAAKIFAADDERSAITLSSSQPTEANGSLITQLDGTITFPRDCVGNVSTTITDASSTCKALFIVIYR